MARAAQQGSFGDVLPFWRQGPPPSFQTHNTFLHLAAYRSFLCGSSLRTFPSPLLLFSYFSHFLCSVFLLSLRPHPDRDNRGSGNLSFSYSVQQSSFFLSRTSSLRRPPSASFVLPRTGPSKRPQSRSRALLVLVSYSSSFPSSLSSLQLFSPTRAHLRLHSSNRPRQLPELPSTSQSSFDHLFHGQHLRHLRPWLRR